MNGIRVNRPETGDERVLRIEAAVIANRVRHGKAVALPRESS